MIIKPKGCHDIYGNEAKTWLYLSKLIDSLMDKYNYNYIRTPIFEASEVFHRGVGETTDIVSKETYDFVDRGDRRMTLRPEGTAGVIRSFIENKMYGDGCQPIKLYYNGTMYRYERPQSGRDRELTQFGVEVLGTDDPLSDAEVISIPVNLYKALGLKEIKVKINSLGDDESRKAYREALVKHFKPEIKNLCPDCQDRYNKNPLRILDCKVDLDKEILKTAPTTIEYLNDGSKERFEAVKKYLEVLDITYEVDPRIVRGLDYYNHTVFEVEANVKGFGSNNILCGGGRYNGLVELLEGPKTPGVGFAMGLGRLVMALELEGIALPIRDEIDAFIMYVSETEKLFAASLSQSLRMCGFCIETEYMGRALKGQFKQADRLNSTFLIILNDNDLKNNEVTVKNNETKEEQKIGLDFLIYYLDQELSKSCGHDCDCDDDCDCGDDCHSHDESCGCKDPNCHCGESCECTDEDNCGCNCNEEK